MTKPSIQEAERMRAMLEAYHPVNHICTSKTKLVIEGYPRSGNSLATNIILEAPDSKLTPSLVAHHTHHPHNLRIASAYGIPKLVIIRNPTDAILSFHIYSDLPVKTCAERYRLFHKGVLETLENTAIVSFDDVIGDFEKVARALKRLGDFGIDPMQDFKSVRARATELMQQRAAARIEERGPISRHVATPNAERDELKRRLRDEVTREIESVPDLMMLFHNAMSYRT